MTGPDREDVSRDGASSSSASLFLSAVPALPVSDERIAVAFYVDVLGFVELLHEGKGLGILRRDDVELHVWVADGSARGAERHLAGSASCRIQVSSIEALYDTCVKHGVVHPNAPLLEQWWGNREFGVVDPDGNLIGLYEHVQK